MDKVANYRLEKAQEIAKKWGWEWEELKFHLSDPGNGVESISAAQTAHAIILELIK